MKCDVNRSHRWPLLRIKAGKSVWCALVTRWLGSYSESIRECGSTLYAHSLRDGMHSSTLQYKLPDNYSTNPTSGCSLWRLTCIEHQFEFEAYTIKNEVCKAHQIVSIHTLFGKKCAYRDIFVCMAHFSIYSVPPLFWPQLHGRSFWQPPKTVVSCDLFIIIIIKLLQTGFLRVYWSECYITYTTRYHFSWEMCFYHWF